MPLVQLELLEPLAKRDLSEQLVVWVLLDQVDQLEHEVL